MSDFPFIWEGFENGDECKHLLFLRLKAVDFATRCRVLSRGLNRMFLSLFGS